MKELDKAHIFDQGKDQEVRNTKHLIGTVNYGTSGYTSDHASAVAQVKWSVGEVASTLTILLHYEIYLQFENVVYSHGLVIKSPCLWLQNWLPHLVSLLKDVYNPISCTVY